MEVDVDAEPIRADVGTTASSGHTCGVRSGRGGNAGRSDQPSSSWWLDFDGSGGSSTDLGGSASTATVAAFLSRRPCATLRFSSAAALRESSSCRFSSSRRRARRSAALPIDVRIDGSTSAVGAWMGGAGRWRARKESKSRSKSASSSISSSIVVDGRMRAAVGEGGDALPTAGAAAAASAAEAAGSARGGIIQQEALERKPRDAMKTHSWRHHVTQPRGGCFIHSFIHSFSP